MDHSFQCKDTNQFNSLTKDKGLIRCRNYRLMLIVFKISLSIFYLKENTWIVTFRNCLEKKGSLNSRLMEFINSIEFFINKGQEQIKYNLVA